MNPRIIMAARALLNWNQADLAKVSGVSQSTIARIEKRIMKISSDLEKRLNAIFLSNGVSFHENEHCIMIALLQKKENL